jgi:beta-catenin-like protein 1
MVLKFEKSIAKNEELRVRFAGDPLKFIESEADLDQEITNLMGASAAPELYPHLVALNTHTSIISLMHHENTDIAIAAVRLLSELTDEDVVAETEEDGEAGMKAFAAALVRIK